MQRPYMVNLSVDMIEEMESDLTTKVQAAYTSAGLSPSIYGVFSLDDLERKTESDLCQKLAVGVGYSGAQPHSNTPKPGPVGSSNAVVALDFTFTIILAVPTGPECLERYNATKLLTVLRNGVLGSKVSGDSTNRSWAFVREQPEITVSTDTMLYYSQVWSINLPVSGPTQ